MNARLTRGDNDSGIVLKSHIPWDRGSMTQRILMKGNEAIAEAAIQAGCKAFFGYPITPQNEIPEYMSRRLPQVGGVFLQAESEISAINMVYGAGGAGARVMTSSSSPGISLKQEGISYIAGAEVPCVIVNIVRTGPGLGGIDVSQGDYFQSTKGGGHGDYRLLVLAPASVQEAFELVIDAFDLADKYRNPVLILGDAILGQMMEPVMIPSRCKMALPDKPWATTGRKRRQKNIINSLYLNSKELEQHTWSLHDKYGEMQSEEVKVEKWNTEDADIVLVAYGTVARICKSAIELVRRQEGIKVGLIRPITLYPFPTQEIADVARKVRLLVVVELSLGQLVDDVRLASDGEVAVRLLSYVGGRVPTPREIAGKILELSGEKCG